MERAGDILKYLLDKTGRRNAHLYSSFFRGWQDIVGISLAEHSRVFDVKNRFVLIEVDHPGWMQKLNFQKEVILRRLKRLYPELDIDDLKIRVNLNFSSYARKKTEEVKNKAAIDNKYKNKYKSEVDRIVSDVKEDVLKKRLEDLFLGVMRRQDENDE